MTGGYRRIPVLQIGADIYCDTQCILRELEKTGFRTIILPRWQCWIAIRHVEMDRPGVVRFRFSYRRRTDF